ncbi:MAG: radical SAM protein [Dehalococcoidales bacterium]|nr:radical SAM protein [Dehalococcoidales bacterium]
MIKPSSLHFLLTYQCIFECDHCFVWGSPKQSGTFTLEKIRNVLNQAKDVGTIKTIYFEGGEPFLYYPILRRGIQLANRLKFRTGIVTNGYWATSEKDAVEWLKPFKNIVNDLSISSDLYHYSEKISQQAQNIRTAAGQLGIPMGVISIAQPEVRDDVKSENQPTTDEGTIMFRGRAVEKLAYKSPQHDWSQFTSCPYENLAKPGRVHVDAYGNVHVCQGISIGNLFRTPLKEICKTYDPYNHPIIAPLLEKGPVELVRRYGIPHSKVYADACHLCYESRCQLYEQFPEFLCPNQMYGIT